MTVRVTVSGKGGAGKTQILSHIEAYLKSLGLDVECHHDETAIVDRQAIVARGLSDSIKTVILEEKQEQ